MKRILLSLLASILLLTTLVSCTAPLVTPDAAGSAILGTGEDDEDNETVTIIPSGSDYADTKLLTQPKGTELIVGNSNMDKNTAHTTDVSVYFPPLEEIISKGRSEIPLYGIYAWFEDYNSYYEEIQDIGFTCLRTTLGRLCSYNAATDTATYYDERFLLLTNDDIEVFVTTGIGTTAYLKPGAVPDGNGQYKPSDFDVEAWIQAEIDTILAFLRRYGPNGSFFTDYPDAKYHPITCIELYNEPNFGYMVKGDDATKREMYARLQIGTYAAIKAEYPEVKILGFGAGGANLADIGFISATLNAFPAAATTMDILTTHPYLEEISPFAAMKGGTSLAGQLKRLRDIAKGAGIEDIPIWYSECGWMIQTAEGGRYNMAWGSTQVTQAAMLTQEYVFGMRMGIERITYMYMMDTDNCNYGVVNYDGSRRLAAYAIETMIEILPNPLITKAIFEGKDKYGTVNGIFAYEVEPEPGARPVTIVFTNCNPTTVSIPWDEPYAVVTDMVGSSILVEADDGAITVDAGACILYIRSVDQVPNLDKVLAKPAPSVETDDASAALAWDEKRYL